MQMLRVMGVPRCRRGGQSTPFYAAEHFPVCWELFTGSDKTYGGYGQIGRPSGFCQSLLGTPTNHSSGPTGDAIGSRPVWNSSKTCSSTIDAPAAISLASYSRYARW